MRRVADFNFVVAGERHSPLAWTLFVIGVMVLIFAADNYAAVASTNERLSDQVDRLKRKGKLADAGATAAGRAAEQRSAGQKSALVERRDAPSPPWESLLREIELAADARVAMLSIDTDTTARRTRLVAEAKTIDDVLAFAARLRESPLFDHVLLLGHEAKKGHAIPVTGFTLQIDWSVE